MSSKKYRLDHGLVQYHNILSLKQAQALIITEKIRVNDQKITKPGHLISGDDKIQILETPAQYVSRGALKLKGAHEAFRFTIQDQHVLDVGISTGGFSDYCLQNGAQSVIGVDVGYGQVDGVLRNHPKLCLIERTNAKQLTPLLITNALSKQNKPLSWANISLVVMDVSFISVLIILPVIKALVQASKLFSENACSHCQFIIMLKPQFEALKEEVELGGVIRDPKLRDRIIARTIAQIEKLGFKKTAQGPCKIHGPKGNIEEFIQLELIPDSSASSNA